MYLVGHEPRFGWLSRWTIQTRMHADDAILGGRADVCCPGPAARNQLGSSGPANCGSSQSAAHTAPSACEVLTMRWAQRRGCCGMRVLRSGGRSTERPDWSGTSIRNRGIMPDGRARLGLCRGRFGLRGGRRARPGQRPGAEQGAADDRAAGEDAGGRAGSRAAPGRRCAWWMTRMRGSSSRRRRAAGAARAWPASRWRRSADVPPAARCS